jgi:glutathione-specific gamma-glutamylcyclotransferase
MSAPAHDLWVFGYGSLMWRPGFSYMEARHARLIGYRRCFCIYSMHHRGTQHRPGLVLGLDKGGACEGIAYRIVASQAAATYRYLRQREQVSGVYREALVPVRLGHSPDQVQALAYMVERAHPNYAGQLPLALQARLIRAAQGLSGANLDYLINTIRHLADLGIVERELQRLLAVIGPHAARANGAANCGPDQPSPSAQGILHAARRLPCPVRGLNLLERRRFLYRMRLN